MAENERLYQATTAALIAGNILSGLIGSRGIPQSEDVDKLVFLAVEMARRVIDQVERTEPVTKPSEPYPALDIPAVKDFYDALGKG